MINFGTRYKSVSTFLYSGSLPVWSSDSYLKFCWIQILWRWVTREILLSLQLGWQSEHTTQEGQYDNLLQSWFWWLVVCQDYFTSHDRIQVCRLFYNICFLDIDREDNRINFKLDQFWSLLEVIEESEPDKQPKVPSNSGGAASFIVSASD